MVPAAHGAELRLRELRELPLRCEVGRADLLEHRVVHAFLRRHADAERDPASDLAHDRVDTAERVEVGAGQVRSRGLVATANVEPDSRRGDVALVGDAAADRLRVARVMVGAENAELGVARRHAALQLLEAALVHVAERLDLHVSILLLRLQIDKTPGGIEPPCHGLQPRASPLGHGVMEPPSGVEPLSPEWESGALPLSYEGLMRMEGFEPPTAGF